MRTFFVCGNWMANPKDIREARDLINIYNEAKIDAEVEVAIAAPYIFLQLLRDNIRNDWVASAENVFDKASGAYTGEVTAPMLKSLDINWTILGHSVRRDIFDESDELIASKAKFSIENDLNIIYCCGEHLVEHMIGKAKGFVSAQIEKLIPAIPVDKWDHVVIAYEPIWAIGTGRVASNQDAQEMCKYIREVIAKKVNADVAANLRILFGGSVRPDNCDALAEQPDIDGFLVGGVSLAKGFINIVNSAARSK